MSPDIEAIAERVRADMGIAYLDAIEAEETMLPAGVSLPDMHVAALEGLTRVMADVILASTKATPAAVQYVADYVVQRVADQVAAERPMAN